ncbi:MAG: formate dehydrogenase subunit gamma [Planctomycetota bacterium]
MHQSADRGPTTTATQQELAVVDAAVARLSDLPGATIPILHAIQDELGYVPSAATERIANALNLSRAEVHGVLTFYHDFRTSPPAPTVIKLCRAEACQAVGCRSLEAHLRTVHHCEMGGTTPDRALQLEPVYCLGNCALGPSALVDGKLVARLSAQRLDAIVAAAKNGKAAGGRK